MSVKKVLIVISLILVLALPFIMYCPLFVYEDVFTNRFELRFIQQTPVYDFSSEVAVSVSAKSALLVDADSLCVFYHKNAKEKAGMASTTKIMTAILAIENLDMERLYTIPKEAVGIEGSSIYLEEGEKLSIKSLLYGLLLESGNDAAVALACAVCGTVGGFVDLMNERAAQLGLCDTHFSNPHGLYDDMHYTTAEDLAVLTAYALKNSVFEHIVSTGKAVFTDGEKTRYYFNHNKLLGRYEGMTGVKTGYTKNTGRCLVTAAKRNGVYLVAVTLDAPDHFNDHIRMLDYGFSKARKETLIRYGEYSILLPVRGGEKQNVALFNTESVTVSLPDGPSVVAALNAPFELCAPLKKGDVYGEVIFTVDSVPIASVKLYVSEDVPLKKMSLWDKLRKEE